MGGVDSHYINEKEIDTESLKIQNTSPTIPDKSICTPIIFILIPNTETLLISHNEAPIPTKLTNPSSDHQTISQNSVNITHAGTDDLCAEMITETSFVADRIYMLQKKSDEKQNLVINLINLI